MRRFVLFTLVVTISLAGCTSPPPPQRDKGFGPKLAAAALHAYETHQTLKIDAITTFPWERFYLFKPKQSPEQIDSVLGFHWATDYSDLTDTYCLLVFVVQKKVTKSLLYPRYQGDCLVLGEGPYDAQSAVFVVVSNGTTTGGQPFLRLAQAPR